jgi:hypothetical protein
MPKNCARDLNPHLRIMIAIYLLGNSITYGCVLPSISHIVLWADPAALDYPIALRPDAPEASER